MSLESMTWNTSRATSRFWLSVVSMLALLMFSACSSAPPEVNVKTTAVELEKPDTRPAVPNPEPIDTAPIEFKVLTPETIPDGEYVFYGITVQDYETLARNMADILRWVKEAKWRLDYYRGEGELDGVSSEPAEPQ